MQKYKIEHIVKDIEYIHKANSEEEAWDWFLDHKLRVSEMAEDYTIYEIKE